MRTPKMHADEVPTDAALVRRLLAAQFPAWAELSIDAVRSAGTDNALYRLGDTMVVRLPRIHRVVSQVDKEHEWLPRLAPQLPLAIPDPLAKGSPADGYPWHWSVYRWLDGDSVDVDRVDDHAAMAADLARFIVALQRIDAAGGPAPGTHNFFRGVPLAWRDAYVRSALAALHREIDVAAAASAWDAALQAPVWQGAPRWIHGDLAPGNLLVQNGRLTAVIDFGGLAVGDPACDLMGAWNFMSPDAREVFRGALAVDDASWARGRGWALSVALIQLPYYRDTNPELAANSRHTIDAVLNG